MDNFDSRTVEGFGDEWSRFDQKELSQTELLELFENYFQNFPFKSLPEKSVGFDLGCGSGRWAKLVAERVGTLNCIDASCAALNVAKGNLKNKNNCIFHLASVDEIPLANDSMDFGYSLGVLHHVPDTFLGIKSCVSKLKKGAPFLIYLYYRFDNRPWWFSALWKLSDQIRRLVSRCPMQLRYNISQIIAFSVYWPLARFSRVLERVGLPVDSFPLSSYRNLSLYTMRTDALDRFGTRLEQRFTRAEIEKMLVDSGLEKISFNEQMPCWCAVGFKR
jgi:SAM-dependent methyltransferase